MATMILDCIGSGNGQLPDGTKPLPEPMLTHHHWVDLHTSEDNSIPILIPQPSLTKISLKIIYSKFYKKKSPMDLRVNIQMNIHI